LDLKNERGKHLVHPNVAFWFTDRYDKALKYKHTNVYPAYLRIQNPATTSVRITGKIDNVGTES
jgi:hypothetical protein